jgi:hypothetical protein
MHQTMFVDSRLNVSVIFRPRLGGADVDQPLDELIGRERAGADHSPNCWSYNRQRVGHSTRKRSGAILDAVVTPSLGRAIP